jgi:hypothetical protein
MTLTILGQVACVAPTTTDDEDVGEVQQAALTQNALTQNALTQNALTDPNAREVLTYIVSCALPADAHIELEIEGDTYDFDGQLGLAPEWGEDGGSCDADCKEWVSACVVARLDYTGESVMISVRGDHDALTPSPKELKQYKHREATYYGNIFSPSQKIFACLPSGQTSIPRVCGPSFDDCIVEVQGNCEDLCGDASWDGSYPDCREQGKSKTYGSITVFLKGS